MCSAGAVMLPQLIGTVPELADLAFEDQLKLLMPKSQTVLSCADSALRFTATPLSNAVQKKLTIPCFAECT